MNKIHVNDAQTSLQKQTLAKLSQLVESIYIYTGNFTWL